LGGLEVVVRKDIWCRSVGFGGLEIIVGKGEISAVGGGVGTHIVVIGVIGGMGTGSVEVEFVGMRRVVIVGEGTAWLLEH
jgi:hypothetical protein